MDATTAAAPSSWGRRVRNASIVLLALVALYALVGFFVLPSLAKSKLETLAVAELGRRATVGRVEFNPFTLRARVSDFTLADREPGRTLLALEALDLELSTATVWHWAPVLDAVRIVRPALALVRNDDGSSNVQDLIDRIRGAPAGPTPQFSIYNIEVDDGAISLDDRPHRRTVAVTELGIGIPFLSSVPHDAKIRVTPRLEGKIDGAHFALAGDSTTPFADTQEATLDIDLAGLSLPRLAEYVPLPHTLKLVDGALTTRLKLAFVTEKQVPHALTLTGSARVDRLAIARRDDSRLVAAKSIDVSIASMDLLRRTMAIERLVVDAPEMALRRFPDGEFELAGLLAVPSGDAVSGGKAARAPDAARRPWAFTVADARLAGGTLHVADDAVTPAFRVTLTNVAMDGKAIASNAAGGTLDVAFDSEEGAHFGARGDIDLPGTSARGHFSLTGFRMAKLYPYYAEALNLDVRRGTLDLTGDFDVSAAKEPLQFTIAQGAATFNDLEMGVRGEPDPLWRFPRADLSGVAFDLAKRDLAIDRADCRQAAFRIVRQSDGIVNFERILRGPERTGAAIEGKSAGGSAPGVSFVIRKLSFERIGADFEDRVPQPPVKLRIADARIAMDNLSNARGAKGTVDAAARIGTAGRLRVSGALATQPVVADWRIDASGIDLIPLRPYFESRTNIVVTGGAVAAKGRVTYAAEGPGGPRGAYKGDVTVTEFGALDRPTSQELARWKTLTLTGVDTANEPFRLALGAVALDEFYARLIVNPDGTLNLQRLLAPEAAAEVPAAPTATTTAGTTTAELPPATEGQKELPVSIGRIQVSQGEVQFSDFFIKPNYSAHLTDVAGSVSALSASQAGDVELSAQVEGTAPVDVRGKLNPFARELTLDLTAKARDIDLPPLTPYSVKYAGYGIQKGKLSLEVHYRIENRRLAANNTLVLDQLTFGEHVDSPTATKLPILLALALLKDRNGVIHLDLPIEGTLDDPKFSVWGVIVQIVVNLITKVVTAPFALLGSLAGGGGEQLAYVEFAPGRADLSAAAEAKLGTLAKALADRPGLKLDATGRAIPDADRDGLKRATLDRAMRAQKQKALVAEGESAPPLDVLKIDAAEYPKYLAAVYRDTKLPDKPRNVLGMAKDIPPAEMEALLLASYGVDEDALRTLANRRAQSVKEWFVDRGGLPSERFFILAPKLSADGITDKGAATRVDFAIR